MALDEKREEFFPQLAKYRKNYSNILKHMVNRMIFTKALAKCEEPYMTIDFASYQDIYVFCDSDPIGYYLNYKHIPYHAVEDGLDCLKIWMMPMLPTMDILSSRHGSPDTI